MPKPKTSPDLTPKPYRLLKSDIAAKLSARSMGGITYLLLANVGDDPELHIAVTANEGGGLWSKEAVHLDSIEAVIDAYAGAPFPTKALRGAMVGRSSNNPPFCLAVLKDLGLVASSPDKAHQHVKAGDWAAFRVEWLAKPGETVIYPEPKTEPDQAVGAVAAISAESDTPEPAASVNAKGKKRKKVVESFTAAGDTDTDDVGTVTEPTTSEANHAPTAHPG